MISRILKKSSSLYLIITNAVLLLSIALLFILFNNDYQSKLQEQNLMDISNINHSSANIAEIFFENRQSRLDSIKKYIFANQLDLQKSLDFIAESDTEQNSYYELIGTDYSGYLISGTVDPQFEEIDYITGGYANLQKIFAVPAVQGQEEEVLLTPIFTDQYSAVKCFALYTKLILTDETGEERSFTLLSVTKAEDFLALINIDGGYPDMSTVLVDNSGQYIINSPEFRSNDFFTFIYDYNGLTLDQKNELQAQFLLSASGHLFFKNSKGIDCVFTYSHIPGSERYAISSVPLSSFHNRNFDFRFTLAIAGILLVLMCVNVFWLLEMNRNLKQSARKEREASEAKTDFLSRMSHDIRTPLNGILGLTELARAENNSPATDDYLTKISYSGSFLLGLVNDILDMNKVESGKMELRPEPYNFEEFSESTHAVIQPLCNTKGIKFNISGTPGMAERRFIIDRLRFNQIIVNLLSNAVKFTPEGGQVDLDFRQKVEGDKMLFDISVKDNGIGMSKEFQKRMFEAFSQEHKAETSGQNGSGLGLAIVKNLVSLMNGTLQVESEEGAGSTFIIKLEAPLADEGDIQPQFEFDEKALIGKHVLVAEDNNINMLIIRKLLETKGIIYDCAENGQVAVEKFSISQPGFYDAILMDIRMPVMDGLQAARLIRNIDRKDALSIPIIAMTANAFDQDVQESCDAGMNAHLAKPVDTDLLFVTLAEQIAAYRKA